MRKRLLVDMDGVLADIYQQAINFEFAESGVRINLAEVNGKDEIVAFPNAARHVRQAGFFRSAPVVEGAVETMSKLMEIYEIFIVSAAMQFPNSLEEKYYWLEEHFPFISWNNIVLCGSKIVVHGDILIDDHFKNLDPFESRTLLYTQPHNKFSPENGHERVNNWEDVARLLL